MRLISELILYISRGFLPHLTNEIYKRNCTIQSINLKETSDTRELFEIFIVYFSRDDFKGLINKLEKHPENFTIEKLHDLIDENITGGLLTLTGKAPIKNRDDYELNIIGASELILERIADDASTEYIGISNNVALVNGIKSTSELKNKIIRNQYVLSERDSVIINRFTGMNAFPLIVEYTHIEDFIHTLRTIARTFSCVRISFIEEFEDIQHYELLLKDTSVPIVTKSFDEIPLYILIVISLLSKKNKLKSSETNIGFIGIDASVLRLTRLSSYIGYQRILGYDANERMMMNFEHMGGLATTPENIFSNADIIVLFKNYFTNDDLSKIRPGLIMLSLLSDKELDKDIINEKGLREFLYQDWLDLSILSPGICQGLVESGTMFLNDNKIIELSSRIQRLVSDGDLLPDIFSDVHSNIVQIIKELSQ